MAGPLLNDGVTMVLHHPSLVTGETERAEIVPTFDPADHKVGEVKDYVEANPEHRDHVLNAEREGKNRETLVKWLDEYEAPEPEPVMDAEPVLGPEQPVEGVQSEENEAPAGDGAEDTKSEED